MTETEYQERLDAIHAASAVRRATAWAAIPFRVLGQPFCPMTPATYSLLLGTENGFACGTDVTLADVKNFLRFHHPLFTPDAPGLSLWRRFRITLSITRLLYRPIRGVKKATMAERVCANFLRATKEIRDHLEEAWADGLPGDGSDAGPTLAASTAASMLDAFAREYKYWPLPQPFRHTPMAQLLQLARCVDRYHGGREAVYFDRAAARLTAEFLRDANHDAMAAAASAPASAPASDGRN